MKLLWVVRRKPMCGNAGKKSVFQAHNALTDETAKANYEKWACGMWWQRCFWFFTVFVRTYNHMTNITVVTVVNLMPISSISIHEHLSACFCTSSLSFLFDFLPCRSTNTVIIFTIFRYGNPDGPQTSKVGIGLSAFSEKKRELGGPRKGCSSQKNQTTYQQKCHELIVKLQILLHSLTMFHTFFQIWCWTCFQFTSGAITWILIDETSKASIFVGEGESSGTPDLVLPRCQLIVLQFIGGPDYG